MHDVYVFVLIKILSCKGTKTSDWSPYLNATFNFFINQWKMCM